MVRDFVHDPAAYYVYTLLELTQYLRQIRPERFFQHADMFDHRFQHAGIFDHRVTRVHRTVNGIEAPRFRSMKVTTTRVVRDRTQGRGDASLKPVPLGPALGPELGVFSGRGGALPF